MKVGEGENHNRYVSLLYLCVLYCIVRQILQYRTERNVLSPGTSSHILICSQTIVSERFHIKMRSVLVITTYGHLIKIQWKVCIIYKCRVCAVTYGAVPKLLIFNLAICPLPTCSFSYFAQRTAAYSWLQKAWVSFFP